jgi:hypothetical protein
MKRSEFDRFVGDRSGREQDASADVHLIVTDEGRRAVPGRWGYLAMAVAIFATAAAILLASVQSGERRAHSSAASVTSAARSTQVPPAAFTSASPCVDAAGYGGLGARVSDFDANNNDSTGAAGPSSGTAFYVVTATARGCVTAFAVQDSATPPLTPRDLLVLVSHPFLPGDAKRVVITDSCAVWKSRALTRATGRPYARATATVQAGSIPGTARIAASSDAAC